MRSGVHSGPAYCPTCFTADILVAQWPFAAVFEVKSCRFHRMPTSCMTCGLASRIRWQGASPYTSIALWFFIVDMATTPQGLNASLLPGRFEFDGTCVDRWPWHGRGYEAAACD